MLYVTLYNWGTLSDSFFKLLKGSQVIALCVFVAMLLKG